MNSIRNKTIYGILWNSTDRIVQQFIRFLLLILFSRLLTPRDFGIIGMLTLFIAVSNFLIDSGFGWALIQKRNSNQSDYSSIFYINLSIGLCLFFVLYMFSPLIADFFNEPQLKNISRFMSFGFIFNSISLIHVVLLTKEINFKLLTRIGIMSILLSGIIGLFFAYNGFGAWSLAIQNVFMIFFKSIFLWIFVKWKPSLLFNFNSVKNLFSFGSKLLIARILNQLFQYGYYLVIGKFFFATNLGYYSQANKFIQYTSENITSIFRRVTFPVFSQIQNDTKRLKRGFRNILSILAYINFPIMIGLIIIGNRIISILLTVKWLPAVPFFQVLCIYGLIYPIYSLNCNIINAKGKSSLFLKIALIEKIFVIIAIVVCLPLGIYALIIGQIIVTYIFYFIYSHYSGRLIDYSIKKQILDLSPYLIISLIMGTIVWFVGEILYLNDLIMILIQIFTGLIIYIVLSKLMKLEALKESLKIMKIILLKNKLIFIN